MKTYTFQNSRAASCYTNTRNVAVQPGRVIRMALPAGKSPASEERARQLADRGEVAVLEFLRDTEERYFASPVLYTVNIGVEEIARGVRAAEMLGIVLPTRGHVNSPDLAQLRGLPVEANV